jgi:hypothetical protein
MVKSYRDGTMWVKSRPVPFFGLALWVAAAVPAGCSGGTVALTPQQTSGPGGATASPTHTTAPASPAPTASHSATPGPLNAAAMNVRMTDVQTFYQTLPHVSVSADIASVAARMSSADGFKNVTISPGGIGANFSDGTPAFIFTDREEDVGGGSSAMSRARRPARGQPFGIGVGASPSPAPAPTDPPPNTTLGPGAPHVIDFVVNTGDAKAFAPSRQYELGSAFVGDGFTAANGYEVDAVNATLENITGLGSSHPLDLFSIATHGAVDLNPQARYVWFSQTPVTDTSIQTYASDLGANRVAVSVYLGIGESDQLSAFAFTPDFLAEHVKFNPGAIVDNESCFGQSPSTAAAVAATLQGAGAGRYFGWTKTVLADDADGFDIFMYDRLIGVGSQAMMQSSLEDTVFRNFAANAASQQRPFPLDAIDAVAYTELRGASLSDSGGAVPLAVSDDGDVYNAPFPPVSDGTASKLVITDFGGESVANPPIEYALPTIRDVQMKDDNLGGELEIDGTFPAAQGTVSIVNASGTFNPAVYYSWSTSKISVRTALEGAGSNGLVTVTAGGITSNAVPLTQWKGTFTYSEADTIPTLASEPSAASPYALPGGGAGSAQAAFSIGLRADVHPIAPSIDTAPEAQNLLFSTFEYDSTAAFNAVSGSFAASNSEYGMQRFSLRTPLTIGAQNVGLQPGFFTLAPLAGTAGCNSASAGVGEANANVFCPEFQLVVGPPFRVSCTSTNVSSSSNIGDPCAGYATGGIYITPGPGELLNFSLDPSSYALTLTGQLSPEQQTLFTGNFVDNYNTIYNTKYSPGVQTPSITSVVMQPVSAPAATTPDVRSRRR